IFFSRIGGAAAQSSAPGPVPTPVPTAPVSLGGTKGCTGFKSDQWHMESVPETHSWKLTGQVEVECEQVKFFADALEYFTDTDRILATGNVVFTNPEGRISAEEVDFNTKTMVGTFKQ